MDGGDDLDGGVGNVKRNRREGVHLQGLVAKVAHIAGGVDPELAMIVSAPAEDESPGKERARVVGPRDAEIVYGQRSQRAEKGDVQSAVHRAGQVAECHVAVDAKLTVGVILWAMDSNEYKSCVYMKMRKR